MPPIRLLMMAQYPMVFEGEILAEAGTRGVITLIGHVEEEPRRSVFLVRFEDKDMNLGNPVGALVACIKLR